MPEEEKKPRDTQFAGFAKLLLPEILDEIEAVTERTIYLPIEGRQLVEDAIAQRAYDFACHVVTQNALMAHGDMNKIPDITKWTEEEKK